MCPRKIANTRTHWLSLVVSALMLIVVAIPAIAATDPSVEDLVNALTKSKPAESSNGGMRMRGLGAKKTAPPDGQVQLSIQFETALATISAESRDLLAKLGAAMNAPALKGQRFRIEGHTDASGDAQANLRLSARRAQSVSRFLMDNAGVESVRLTSAGKGSSEPIDGANPLAAVNRRVVVIALSGVVPESAPVSASVPSAEAGSVRQLQGAVSVTRANAPLALSTGDAVREGDTIVTAAGASALLQLEDGAKLLVRPNTNVILSRMVNTGALERLGHSIDLAVGAIRYVTGIVGKSRPQGVLFKTPSATIGIRGTDFEIVHAPKQRSLQGSGTYVRVNSGEIELGGIDGSTLTLSINEQAFAGAVGAKMRGGGNAPAIRKLASPANVFSSGELDQLLEGQ